MKKLIFTALLICVTCSAMAQHRRMPKYFRNTMERRLYETRRPARCVKQDTDFRFATDFDARLDSVIGANDFDWTKWKNIYTYNENGQWATETTYELQDNAWVPTERGEFSYNDAGKTVQELYFKQVDEEWIQNYKVETYYNSENQIDSIVNSNWNDEAWVGASKTEYTYENGLVSLLMSYRNSNGAWTESSKYEYTYNAENQMIFRLYSTIRNGNWRESSRDTLCYENGLLASFKEQVRSMGWGGSSWRDSYRYEYTYNDGLLTNETYYSTGMGGTPMSLKSMSDYEYDANGDLTAKTTSIFNETDWIVRDEYQNTFDPQHQADKMMGAEALWKNFNYFSNILGETMPIHNRWLASNIMSSSVDTHFEIYYSDMAGVAENQLNATILVSEGQVSIATENPENISVYDVLGRMISQEQQTSNFTITLKPGLYLIKIGEQTSKVVIK